MYANLRFFIDKTAFLNLFACNKLSKFKLSYSVYIVSLFYFYKIKKYLIMNIALIGYGKMGKEIEKIAIERGHSILLVIDENNQKDLDKEHLKKIDVAIEFTSPKSAFSNYLKCFESNIPIVSGTTGWLNKFSEIKEKCEIQNQAFFYASNFSLGVNVFFELNKRLAQLMSSFDNYNVELEEIHHLQKIDAPSGTAITIAEHILEHHPVKTDWALSPTTEQQLKITAKREADVPGTHIVKYESDIDKIEIRHQAKNRKGFALGAVLAAEFLKDKKGLYSMQDLLHL